jgi:hypothetical protein
MSDSERPVVVSFVDSYFASEAFAALHSQGMTLAQECAIYLYGPQKREMLKIPWRLKRTFSSESKRLAERILVMSEWLLLMRHKGKDAIDDAVFRKQVEKTNLATHAEKSEQLEKLPEEFVGLVDRSHDLLAKINRLNKRFFHSKTSPDL